MSTPSSSARVGPDEDRHPHHLLKPSSYQHFQAITPTTTSKMGIPIASYGANPEVGIAIRDGLAPEYEIVHVSLNLAAALVELPKLASGDTSVVTERGTNSVGDKQVPVAIIFAGSLPADEVAQVKAAVAAKAPSAKLIQVTKDDVLATGATAPDPALIAKLYKEKLNEALA
ncbi:hypothetical protein B0T25DRAFT_571253 [Lasiosphaeria hispida]|uniref:Uncharacterized protein n=1 Tax=Lasiosphaeria hispida TaxID=260671 RepID=A0AAJ0HB66_9PEZI|nr:hypothetical protein B0T25DRAFT_571253 [Lasiosphaeria hispida]